MIKPNKPTQRLFLLSLLLIPIITHAEEIQYTLDYSFAREMTYIMSLVIAFLLGCISGITLTASKKNQVKVSAKTYGAVALGSSLFTCICLHQYANFEQGNSLSSIGSIISGIGFLCAAVIFKEGPALKGLSTSTSLWTTASIGVACGTELYTLAIFSTLILSLFHLMPSGSSEGFVDDAIKFSHTNQDNAHDQGKDNHNNNPPNDTHRTE